MMIKRMFMLFLLGFLTICFISNFANITLAKPIDSTTLINNAAKFDGKEVEFQGEAIGEIMKRGNFAWVNVYDGQNAIGIFMPYNEVKKIKVLGKYLVKGDMLNIKGTFNRACKVHGGDLDIHAKKVEIVKKGYKIDQPTNNLKAILGIGLFMVGSILMWYVFKNKW